MSARDPSQLFGLAEQAFAQGRLDEALPLLQQVATIAGPHPQVLHLMGLVQQRQGALDRAAISLQQALRLAPNDGQIANNLGNLLDALGRSDEALVSYDKAARITPGWPDPLLNRGIMLHRLSRHAEARSAYEAAIAIDGSNARAWAAIAALDRDVGDLEAAADGFDQALALASGYPLALRGRARVAMERGEASASRRLHACLQHAPDDPEIILALAETLDAEGNPDGVAILANAVAQRPDWLTGHDMLARMRAEARDSDFARSFAKAVAADPANIELRRAHWRTLVRANDHQGALALIDAARPLLDGRPDLALEEAAITSEAGDIGRAEMLFDGLDDNAEVRLAKGRHALRLGDPDRASSMLEAVVAQDIGAISAWAHLSLAWRLLDDPRHDWLCGQDGLFGTVELAITPTELSDLAVQLRSIHKARAAPIGQSLRGGTQTRGRLLARTEPEIADLTEALRDAVSRWVEKLPPVDPAHPLLRHRDGQFNFDGSWSVRLLDGGTHINHIHPQGVLSSACYIALPAPTTDDPTAGWLELGAPPVELGLSLPPLAVIEPQPGRLALFPSYLFHGTRPFVRGERLTVAFDLVPQR